MRRAATFAFAACVACLAALDAAAAALDDPFPGAAAAYLVQVDGKALWGAREDAALPPASLTKLMTALLVADAPPDAVVTVSARAARATGARMGLVAGQRFRTADLVAALLLRSANDACVALAEHVAGSEAAFVERMNGRAQALRMTRTRFRNPCGFDAPGHASSAADLARLAGAFLAVPSLARWVAAERHPVRDLAGKRTWDLVNTNALLGRIEGARGVKTGFTAKAGDCLIGYAVRDGRAVLLVMLGARDRWWDAVAMMERAFAHAGPAR